MFKEYLNFIRGVSVNRIGLLGVVITTSSFITFSILELARLVGFLTNTYIGLITYLVFPALFILGLILIPIGWRRRKRQTGKSTRELLDERFESAEIKGGFLGSRLFMTIVVLTLVNILFMSALSSRMLHFMDSPRFCGTACHTVMNPEWMTYQESPHARVKCVECHVGEGAKALLDSKLNGIWQIISLTFNLYERPIPTPVRRLRPARETCEKCHWPDKFYGGRMITIVNYDQDRENTPKYTALDLHVDAGKWRDRRGIHWHIAQKNAVRYVSLNDKRLEMIWVEARQPDGSFKRYTNRTLKQPENKLAEIRVVDCIDCHNRATHIYENPSQALDDRLMMGLMDRSLPFLKREGLAALMMNYPDTIMANQAIANHLNGFYERQFPEIAVGKKAEIDSAIAVLQQIYRRNIHPNMHITWGSYPSHIGHENDQGCFRCHNSDLVDKDGQEISYDCDLCHSILSQDDPKPFGE